MNEDELLADLEIEMALKELEEAPAPAAITAPAITAPTLTSNTVTIAQILDWSGVSSAQRQKITEAAERIHKHMGDAGRSMFEIGKELLVVKDILEHGKFGPWLEANFDFDPRTAQRWMAVAEKFDGKYDTVSYLPGTVIQKLAATKNLDTLREEIIKEIERGGRPTKQEVEARIEAAMKEGRQKREEREQRKREENARLEEERYRQARERELKDAGKTDAEIAVERQKWDTVKARNECDRKRRETLKQKKEEEHRLRLEKAEERERWASEVSKKAAEKIVELLRRRLGADFETFRKGMARVLGDDFIDALKNAPVTPHSTTTKARTIDHDPAEIAKAA
jgi:hypothetical protein